MLFIQIVIISTLSLFLFHQNISSNANAELSQDLEQTNSSLAYIKQTLFNRVFLLRYTIEEMQTQDLAPDTLHKRIRTHFNSVDTDRVVLLAESGEVLFRIDRQAEKMTPIEESLELGQFDFLKSKYVFDDSPQQQLYLITGTKVYHPEGKRYYLLFINSLDKDFAYNLYKKTGINFVLFVKDQPICSVVPDFTLPPNSGSTFNEIKIASTPYRIKTDLLSSAIPGGLRLTVLRSHLQDSLYLRWLTTIFIVSFFVTLIISLGYIVGVTNRILFPFYELNSWLAEYLKTGKSEELSITQAGGEIEFLTQTFYSMVQKLIKEEQIIRKQLHEISFLNRYNTEIMENLKAGVLILDPDGFIDFLNQYLRSILQIPAQESIIGTPYTQFFTSYFNPEGKWTEFPKLQFGAKRSYLLSIKDSNNIETKLSLKLSYLDENDQQSRVLIVLEDITDTERIWNKILITEKVSSMGLLSAGMAHEINNPLGSIQSHINYLKAVEGDAEKKDSIMWLETETKRIEGIVKQVLTFSHDSDTNSSVSDIHSVIHDVIEVSKYSIRDKDIHIDKQLRSTHPSARIPQDEAKQVFLNLFLNATQAIETQGGISFTTENRGAYVHVIIEDSGNGIDAEHLKDIFNPFFTTKSSTKANGLGLSIVYNILRKAGGDIHIQSTVQKGTTVEVTLPVADKGENESYEHFDY
ncbi:MAG: ATP-binding protein [Spirochaetia bacterium]|nr:ATP-binding protein [Spirochaetia bacterium]